MLKTQIATTFIGYLKYLFFFLAFFETGVDNRDQHAQDWPEHPPNSGCPFGRVGTGIEGMMKFFCLVFLFASLLLSSCATMQKEEITRIEDSEWEMVIRPHCIEQSGTTDVGTYRYIMFRKRTDR